MDTQALPKLGYSIEEACASMGLGETKLRELIKSGDLLPSRIGRRVLISREAMEACLRKFQAPGLSASEKA